MTVCLTGDVHHASLDSRDQDYLDPTEVEAAIEYADLAASHGVPVTLFVTGKAATEEPDAVRRLAERDNVSIGGHGFHANDTFVHRGWHLLEAATSGLVGSWNGPRWFQEREIARTVEAFNQLGIDIESWRNHAYRHDEHTNELLGAHGIGHVSNAVGPDERVRLEDGLTVVPVNTPPDHEHVYHGFRTPEFVADRSFDGPFGSESWPVDKWVDRVLDRLDEPGVSSAMTVLAHPACMKIADDFGGFDRLCGFVSEKLTGGFVEDVGQGSFLVA
jgi:hypothetical protein